MSHTISIDLPTELIQAEQRFPHCANDEALMQALIKVSENAIGWGYGGPFAAAVVRIDTQELISLGINLVLDQKLSTLHAEMVAIMIAQRRLGHFDLAQCGGPFALFTSCEPCTMCLGASHWSGVSKVISGARDCDAAAAGFDEGPKPHDWAQALRERGIDVREDVCRAQAAKVLKTYQAVGGDAYNSLRNDM
ncbi:MAG TPA: nucleoside deaminase [Pseudomonadales bacterium]|nr:nucleoside deaminase [Pseudomonadales bacterium]